MYRLMNSQGGKIERFKRFRLKSCRSISFPVKNMASGAPRGHITTGIFSTDKVRSKSGLILPLFVDDGSAFNVSTRNCFKSL